MKKILFIPPHPGFQTLKIRMSELARFSSEYYEVYLLDWHFAVSQKDWLGRIEANMKDLLRPIKVHETRNLKVVETPMLRRPLALAPSFNMYWLERFIRKEGIRTVINGSYHLFSSPAKRDFEYIVDLADVPVSSDHSALDGFIDKIMSREVKNADAVTACSRGLVEYVRSTYGVQVHFLPNGTELDVFRKLREKDGSDIRRRYGLEGKWIIGYAGYMGPWVDVDFLADVFDEVKRSVPNAALLLVGGSPFLSEYRKRFSGRDIVFTGPLDSDVEIIEEYFLCFDAGVIPHPKTEFQDLAFHIKLIEYTAAGKFVVASDLEEIKKLDFPNVFISPRDKDNWVKLLLRCRQLQWESSWSDLVRPFDWRIIVKDLRDIIESIGERRA